MKKAYVILITICTLTYSKANKTKDRILSNGFSLQCISARTLIAGIASSASCFSQVKSLYAKIITRAKNLGNRDWLYGKINQKISPIMLEGGIKCHQ
ncbi:hypothetical protein [Flavivirga spongiicola]|uniref:Uncharacterized protein n=1 Tax=Flavivirga spongiicola TaxID=421621 RepID=A0ABU7XUQ6_9FLAO|nr:hypothetical protein [Flavivirga sp. MEBiC05379]MDO5979248.1 hypothetical protein [Flavivirga sp. MEBiC05379]